MVCFSFGEDKVQSKTLTDSVDFVLGVRNRIMSKTLVLIDNNRNGFFPNRIGNNDIFELYKSNSKINRILRKIVFKYNLPFSNFFLTSWYNQKTDYDKVIMFDTGNAKYLIKIISKFYPKARKIIWFWNSVEKTINTEDVRHKDIELWSFDPHDCNKYDLKYNTQFYISEFINSKDSLVNPCSDVDVFFVGTDKGRIKQLTKLKHNLDQMSVSSNFYIVGDPTKYIPGWNMNYKVPIEYNHILEHNRHSKAIVDIVSDGQNGLTLRPLEALFMKKKLITNMKSISKFKLYNRNNIYIIDEESDRSIKNFIESPYDETGYIELRSYYSFENWIERFDEENAEDYV